MAGVTRNAPLHNYCKNRSVKCPRPTFLVWHVTCAHIPRNKRMATRMNVMKLLQEVRGLTELPNQHLPKAVVGQFLLQQFMPRFKTPGARHIIRIIVQDPPDIPHPVRIIHLTKSPKATASAQF